MTWRNGEFTGTELAFRCFHCGDSQKHPDKAHCSVNIYTNVYYCLRCSASGRFSGQEMGFYTKGIKLDPIKTTVELTHRQDDFLETLAEKIRSGPGADRYSGADRYHVLTQDGKKIDTFKSVLPCGTVVGYHFRPEDKSQTRTYGQKMFIMSSKIRRNRPWRLVEGAYDILDPHCDVACIGFPTEAQVKTLAGYSLILCPDGDVFEDYRKLKAFMKPFLYNDEVFIEGVEHLPPATDPDEILPSNRKILAFDQIRQMLKPKRTFFLPFMGPEQILEDIRNNLTEEEFWKKVDKA